MQAFFSSDGSYVAQYIVTFLVILALLVAAAYLSRRLFGRSLSLVPGTGSRGRQPRLGIVDIYELDRHRQLILLRRDNVEHLLLVGGPNDVVIERNIQRGAGARYTAEGAREPEPAAPDALDGPRAERFLDSPAPPTFAMPEVVPPDLPGAEPVHPERSPPLDPGLFEPEEPSAPPPARPASAMSRLIRRTPPPLANLRPDTAAERPNAATPPASEPVPEAPPVIAGRGPRAVDPSVLSDMARQLQVALKRPSSAVTPPPGLPTAPAAPTPPPASMPEPKPLDPLAAAMAAAQADPLDAPAPPKSPPTFVAAPAAAEPKPAPKPADIKPAAAKPVEAKPVEAKPVETTAPVPEAASSAAPAPKASEPKAALAKEALAKEPLAEAPPAKAPEPVPAEPPPEPRPATPVPARTEVSQPEAPKPDAVKSEPAKAEPPKPEPPKPDLAEPDLAKPEPAPSDGGAQGQSPFSVEEIEAEFARLLGRPLDTKR